MMDNNGHVCSSGPGKKIDFSGPDLAITGEKNDLRDLLERLEKIGLKNDRQWNENVAFAGRTYSGGRNGFFILLHSCSKDATVFTDMSSICAKNTVKAHYNGRNHKEILSMVRQHLANITLAPDEPVLEVGGYEIKIEGKNVTTIAGFTFDREFWLAANTLSQHVKAKVKVGCSHQFDLDRDIIWKVIESMNKHKPKK